MGAAQKIFERMQRTRSGWGQDDFRRLYRGFGFVEEEGGSHRLYSHPQHGHLRATVGRHNELAKGYADTAVRLIEELKRLQDEEQSHE